MHIERLTKLAEWLEAGGKHENVSFDMSKGLKYYVGELKDLTPDTVLSCETACCIAGAAVQFFNDPKGKIEDQLTNAHRVFANWNQGEIPWDIVRQEAEELLQLCSGIADALFEPSSDLNELSDPAWAARVIRRLIETGEVDWEAERVEEAVA